MEIFFYVACFAIPLLMGWAIGSSVERRHFAELDAREDQLRTAMIVTQMKTFLYPTVGSAPPRALTAEVVIATDYLKTYLAGWKGFFGGEIRSYRTLLERARREATLRILEEAHQLGYNAVGNIRFDPCEIGGAAAMAAIVATGTAYNSSIEVRGDFVEEKPLPSLSTPPSENPYHSDEL